MKKLLFVALVGTFVACGEATETTETTETPVEVTVDTVVAPVDTLVVDTAAAPVDSAK